ncbi:MAG: HDIG domain-containing protein [Acidimicrobiia bacterium]|nr:HDIG domain-containing protein [Acidimicrobiia bacterium]MDH3471197.1 HDIG domain-containing protein [Acidimicrobiia bacterium]
MRSRTQRPGIIRAMVLGLTIVLVGLALVAGRHGEETLPVPVAGQPSPSDFVATADYSVTNVAETNAARELARASVDTIFQEDTEQTAAALRGVQFFFEAVKAARAPVEVPAEETPDTTIVQEEGVPDDQVGTETVVVTTVAPLPADKETQLVRVREAYPLLNDSTIEAIVDLRNLDFIREDNGEETFFGVVQAEANDLTEELLVQGGGITATQLDSLQSELVTAPRRLNVPGMEEGERDLIEAAVADVVANSLRVNRRPDDPATEAAREAAAAGVPDVTVAYVEGELIAGERELVTEADLEAIVALGLIQQAEPPRLAALATAAGLVVLLAGLFIWRTAPDTWRRPKLMALFGLLTVLAALAARLPEVIAVDRPELGYLIPAAAFGYLAAILFDSRTALLMAIPVGAFTALANSDVSLAVYAAAATTIPVPFVSAASSRTSLRLGVLYTGAATAPLAASLAWFFSGADQAWQAGAAGFAAGSIAGIVALGVLPFLENTFRITTTLTLLDLTDRNHPALRLLEENAPGSFNHSVLVGTLAGKAARAIGANPLLAQAAAYYHDLGKAVRPQYFIENQFGVSNPHDEMTPEESAEVVREHVSEGLRLARQYRIPAEVADGIRMHHGNSIMRFFYHRALELDPGASPNTYRHNGVKPVRKEMAILMLSDACEGATRSLVQQEDPSTSNIGKLVDQIIYEKLEDGQLDESSLTFGELTKVKGALVEALIGYYHTRVPYPGFGPQA